MGKVTSKYNSDCNILGSVPDYSIMIDYINHRFSDTPEQPSTFQFRTAKSTSRFIDVIDSSILNFASDAHKEIFLSALVSSDYSLEEKLIILFWQVIYCNALFSEITENVFLRALYSGRTSISKEDVSAFIKHLCKESPDDIRWSDGTVESTASKYLTILKKFGFADGKIRKEIRAPHTSSSLFNYFVKFALTVYPDSNTLDNKMFKFSFLDTQSIINRLKAIDNIPLWDITQIGNDVTITLK